MMLRGAGRWAVRRRVGGETLRRLLIVLVVAGGGERARCAGGGDRLVGKDSETAEVAKLMSSSSSK